MSITDDETSVAPANNAAIEAKSGARAAIIKRVLAGAIVLLLLATGVILYQERQKAARASAQKAATRARYDQDLAAVKSSLALLRERISAGPSYYSYTRELGEVLAATENFLRSHPVDELPPTREIIKAAVDDYFLAQECWKKKLDNRFNYVASERIDDASRLLPASDPLYGRITLRFPKLQQAEGRPIDLDVAMRTAWQSAEARLNGLSRE